MGDAMKADGAFIGQDASVTPLIGKLRLHIQGYVDKEDFFISPLKHEDVILGAPWFDRLAASIKFPERRISFKFRKKNMYIDAQESGNTIPLVHTHAFDKSIKSSISVYMIFVKDSLSDVNKTQVNESGLKEDLELSKYLNQFQDVFIDDIPGELPPKRGDDDHAIELIPGSSPPNKPPYRVSQAQQEEIMRQVNELVEKGMITYSCCAICSEFSDIFDVDHFKKSLRDDVLIVSSLPSTHVMTRLVQERSTPLHATPQWFRSHYLKRLNREGLLLLRGMDGRLSKELPQDLQKLRCKVAFHALRFTLPIMELGNRLARRMWERGPYVALHLRLEKDVWVRTGCLPGLGPGFDDEVQHARIENPQLLTGRSNMTYTERKLAGLCLLNAAEVARLLKGLGASRSTNIFWAGGRPLGGDRALNPLIDEFGLLYNKENLALPGELEPFAKKASNLAAVDYIVSLHSDVFMPSHGGNMAKSLQGHRAYAGYRKHITPNKREILPYFLNTTALPEADLDIIIKEMHNDSLGHTVFRTDKRGRDVLAYPAPDCMCNNPP
ncbi:hypothetical protein L7F22_031983 [Adiantum nelumboides]|nr:hypothetical protein [Adiantum nelumboides]